MARPAEPSRLRARLRTAVRTVLLAAAFVAASGLLPWQGAVVAVADASPFVAAASALATRTVGVLSLAAAPVLVLALVRRRWFCRWACPVGLMSETLGRLRRRRRRRTVPGRSAETVAGTVPHPPPGSARSCDDAAGTRTRGARPAVPRLGRRPAVGQWALFLTLGGASLGYPVLVWLDPLAMFTATVGAWFGPAGPTAWLVSVPLAVVLVVSVLWPGVWCSRLCPLGGMQDVLALPAVWLRQRGTARTADDPDDARTVPAVAAASASASAGGRAVGRRFFLGVGAGGAVALATRAAGRGASPPIRPPGAADEDRFVGLCLRCGNCVRACPAGVLEPALGEGGPAGFLAPRVVFDAGYCREDCNACGQVCPSGAIARLSLPEKQRRTMGVAKVEPEKCVLAGGQECAVCVSACPYQAVDVVAPEAAFPAYPYPRVIEAACVGCGACEYECPTAPPRAIRVVPGAGTLSDRI